MHKLSLGKRTELRVWSWLIDEGFDVYPSLVDDKGIDGLVGFKGYYYEVQIKSGKNWSNQRGIKADILENHPNRIFLIVNYTLDEVRYFTSTDILNEQEWTESTKWKIPQIKLNRKTLEKYQAHNWDGFVQYLKSGQA
ncbi:hypothetical protein Q9X94_003775 [Vibrio alginolyticus]|nr:hypothetical protein [Vibrio alginolyticus]